MKIIGIDPGYDRLGIAVIEKPAKGKEKVLYSDCFTTSAKDDIYERLKQVGGEISRIIEMLHPDAMAIETLFITNNQKTGMRVAEARGIIIYEALEKNIPVFEYSPPQIKAAITGDGKGDKSQMIKMIPFLVSMDTRKRHDDEYDAIAIALTHAACAGKNRL